MAGRDSRLVITEQLSIPLSELQFSYVRSSGPGGQNVNKVSSQAQLSWDLTQCQALPPDVRERLQSAEAGRISKAGVLRINCRRFRDRERNRQDCLDRLREMIVEVLEPPKKRRRTRLPRRAREQRLREKHQRGEVKRSRRRPHPEE